VSAVVIDASAILAAILGEPGGDAVFDMLDNAVVSTVNVAEVYTCQSALDIDPLSACKVDPWDMGFGLSR